MVLGTCITAQHSTPIVQYSTTQHSMCCAMLPLAIQGERLAPAEQFLLVRLPLQQA
jgi:hypothetical protein